MFRDYDSWKLAYPDRFDAEDRHPVSDPDEDEDDSEIDTATEQ